MEIVVKTLDDRYKEMTNYQLPYGSTDIIKKEHSKLIDSYYTTTSDRRSIETECGYMIPIILKVDKEGK